MQWHSELWRKKKRNAQLLHAVGRSLLQCIPNLLLAHIGLVFDHVSTLVAFPIVLAIRSAMVPIEIGVPTGRAFCRFGHVDGHPFQCLFFHCVVLLVLLNKNCRNCPEPLLAGKVDPLPTVGYAVWPAAIQFDRVACGIQNSLERSATVSECVQLVLLQFTQAH